MIGVVLGLILIMFGVRVIKQGIVPCKLLIAASKIAVFVGCNITDATPNFFEAPH